jgi:peptidoglycan/LPS O-acetylase OafA/YrhL
MWTEPSKVAETYWKRSWPLLALSVLGIGVMAARLGSNPNAAIALGIWVIYCGLAILGMLWYERRRQPKAIVVQYWTMGLWMVGGSLFTSTSPKDNWTDLTVHVIGTAIMVPILCWAMPSMIRSAEKHMARKRLAQPSNTKT